MVRCSPYSLPCAAPWTAGAGLLYNVEEEYVRSMTAQVYRPSNRIWMATWFTEAQVWWSRTQKLSWSIMFAVFAACADTRSHLAQRTRQWRRLAINLHWQVSLKCCASAIYCLSIVCLSSGISFLFMWCWPGSSNPPRPPQNRNPPKQTGDP